MATNYAIWKDSELKDELQQRGITLTTFTRQEAVAELKRTDVMMAKASEIHIESEDEDGNLKSEVVSDLKRDLEKQEGKEVQLMLSRVIFHNRGEDDIPYVPVGHNGRCFYIPKEIEVDVPDYILDSVIKDAVEVRSYPETQMDGSIIWKTKRIQRFPYSLIKHSFPAQ